MVLTGKQMQYLPSSSLILRGTELFLLQFVSEPLHACCANSTNFGGTGDGLNKLLCGGGLGMACRVSSDSRGVGKAL